MAGNATTRSSPHEEILEHAEVDGRVLDADVRYEERQARWHGRLIGALLKTWASS
jgi:hypothetical protein